MVVQDFSLLTPIQTNSLGTRGGMSVLLRPRGQSTGEASPLSTARAAYPQYEERHLGEGETTTEFGSLCSGHWQAQCPARLRQLVARPVHPVGLLIGPAQGGPGPHDPVGGVLHYGSSRSARPGRTLLWRTRGGLGSLPQGARRALRRRERRCYPPAAFTSAAHAFSSASPYGLLLARARFCRFSRHQLWWGVRMLKGG